jgi:hypothetical protein
VPQAASVGPEMPRKAPGRSERTCPEMCGESKKVPNGAFSFPPFGRERGYQIPNIETMATSATPAVDDRGTLSRRLVEHQPLPVDP